MGYTAHGDIGSTEGKCIIMKVTAKVSLNMGNIKTLIEAAKKAQEDATYAIGDDVTASQTVPYRSGKLEFSADVDDSEIDQGRTAVTFNTPYARRIYFNPDGWKIHQTYNSNAQSMWLQTYIDGAKQGVPINEFKDKFKEYAKGVIK